MNEKQQDSNRRKRNAGRRCAVMFCGNKTNADGLSLHQFPADESARRQWIPFVRTKENLTLGHQVRVTFAATIF